METETKIVGGAENEAVATEEPKVERKGKPLFDLTTAKNAEGENIALDENGRLPSAPSNWDPKYRNMGRPMFADHAAFLDHKADQCSHRIVQISEHRELLLLQAKEAREGVDPKVLKLRKLSKMREQLEALEAQMLEDGIEF